MIKRLLSGESKTITSAAIIIGAASLVSRLLGVLRDRVLAGEFGAGETLDIYYAAFRIPDLVYNLLILGALSAGFIPVFIRYFKKSEDEGWRLAAAVLNVVIIGVAIISAVLFVFTPWLVSLLAPGFSAAAQASTVTMTRIMFLSPLFLGISAVWGGILQSQKKFFVYSLAPIFYNVGIMIGALFFVTPFGIDALAWGVVLGAFLHMIVQLPSIFGCGFRYRPILSLRHAGVREIIVMMVPRVLGLAVSQVNLFVVNIIASMLAAGSIAVFNLANNLQSFPLGIFGVSFAIAAFPTLSAAVAGESKEEFVKSFSVTARQILFFIIPLSALFLVLRAQIVRAVLGAGSFDWEDTILTADALAFFSVSLFAQGLIPLLVRGFFAWSNTMIPLIAGLIGAMVNIALAWVLAADYGVAGLALAFSVSSIIQVIILWLALRHKTNGLDEVNIIFAVVKISLATLTMSFTTQYLKYVIEPYTGTETFIGIFSQGLLAGLGGILVFILVSLFLRSEEMLVFAASFKRRFLRKEAVEKVEEEIES
ncbi:MAG: murein biosynthesis integral membrane protein MurJ [Patescibacteria group bacterium]|jgi:putative peptidoglycan lipid II flippase